LAEHFAARFAREEGCAPVRLGAEARARFAAHSWPGNVRELGNLIERLTILYPGEEISARHLPPELATAGAVQAQLPNRFAAAERDLLLEALARASGRKAIAAQALGISRHALKRRLKRLKLL
jgi:DNA-binding NtrC family response regulator